LSKFIKKKVYRSFRYLIFIFPITLFIYLFLSDFGQIGNLLFLTKNLFPEILLGLLLISFGYILRYYRWRLIINSFGFYPLANTEYKLWLASYSFTATPGKIGELIRGFFLKKIFNIPLKYSFFSILFERIFDFISVIFFLLCFLIINSKNLILPLKEIYIIFIIFFIIFNFLIIFKLANFRKIIKSFFDIKINFSGNVFKFGDFSKLNNFKNLLRINFLIKITFLSIFSWFLEGIAFLLLLIKSNFDISPLLATVTHTSAGLVGALTMLPGGLGLTEAFTVFILKSQTIPIEYGIPITSIIRLMTLWYISLLGIISLFIIRKKVFEND